MRSQAWIVIGGVAVLLCAGAAAAGLLLVQDRGFSNQLTATATALPQFSGPVDQNVGPAPTKYAQTQRPQSAPAQPGPTRVETTTYDSRTVTCRDPGTAKNTCVAALRATGKDAGQLLLIWQILKNPQGQWLTSIRVPTGLAVQRENQPASGGIVLQHGVALKFGNQPGRKIALTSCNPQTCAAEGTIDEAFIQEAITTGTATFSVQTVAGNDVSFEMSIKGLDKAITLIRP